MVCSKVQHVAVDGTSSDDAALDSDTLRYHGHVGDLKVVVGHGHGEDGRVHRHDGHDELPVGANTRRNEESIDLAAERELGLSLHGDELAGAEFACLLFFAVGAGEHDDVAAHLGRELDGQVAEAANADYANAVGGLDAVGVEGVPDGGSAAHERRGLGVCELLWDLEQERLFPHAVRGEAALVEIGAAVHLAVVAVVFAAGQAAVTAAAAVVLVAPADAVALLQALDVGSNLVDDAGALVAEDHVGTLVVLICAAETGSGNFDEDLVTLEIWSCGFGLDNLALLAALEYCEARHGGGDGVVCYVCSGKRLSRSRGRCVMQCWRWRFDVLNVQCRGESSLHYIHQHRNTLPPPKTPTNTVKFLRHDVAGRYWWVYPLSMVRIAVVLHKSASSADASGFKGGAASQRDRVWVDDSYDRDKSRGTCCGRL